MKMMFAVVVAAVVVPGCGKTPAPAPTRTPQTLTFLKYVFAFNSGEDLSAAGHRNSVQAADGTETELDEDISVKCGKREARILNGSLTVDGKDRGAVKPPDRITFTTSGGVSVNGVDR